MIARPDVTARNRRLRGQTKETSSQIAASAAARRGIYPQQFKRRTYAVKSCGKAHSHCRVCAPDVSATLSKLWQPHSGKKCTKGCTCRRHSNPGKKPGWHHTKEARAKIAASNKACPPNCTCKKHTHDPIEGRLAQRGRRVTRIHKALQAFLQRAGFNVVIDAPFGRYQVDCYVPDYHLAFEADGDYWHSLPDVRERDARRDIALLQNFNLPTVRFSETEIKERF